MRTNLSPGRSDPHQALIVAIENAFAKHAGAILCDVAAEVKAKDAQECLAKLRGEITEAIVQWIEPSEEHFEDELRLRLTDLTPDGEWEQRLEEAYEIFRPQHPAIASAWACPDCVGIRTENRSDSGWSLPD